MPYTHGGDIYGDAAVELDFSVNTNRLGMPQAVRDAVIASAAAWEQYPDALCRKLRRAAAAFYEADGTPIPEDWLVFGNGASDILYAVVSTIRPKQAILLAPGFSEYEQALRMCGCEIRWLHLKEENGFSLESAREELYAMLCDGSGDASKIDSVPTLSSKHENVWEKILILGNPNNPTGHAISATELERLAEVCRETHTWLMLDECFQWFLDTRREGSFVGNLLNGVGDHVILLNALTKICSMAGLRLGYGIIPNAGLRERLEKFRQPWSVSAPAQAGSMIGPLAMLISGMLIAGTTPQEILAFPHIGLVTILRLIGVPLLTILLLKFSGLASFAENGSQILLVTLLATITPSASTITQMAQVYGKDARYAGAINVITTLLCMITMPIMVYLYQL